MNSKKKVLDDTTCGNCSSSSIFFLKKLFEWLCPSDQPDHPLSAVTLIGHDGNFESTVGILLGQIKGQDLASLKKKYPSSTPINKGRFHGLREEEIRGQSLTKTNLYLFFFIPNIFFSSLRHYHHLLHLPKTTTNKSTPPPTTLWPIAPPLVPSWFNDKNNHCQPLILLFNRGSLLLQQPTVAINSSINLMLASHHDQPDHWQHFLAQVASPLFFFFPSPAFAACKKCKK